MNITEQTLNELKLEDLNHQWLWGVLLGSPLAIVGLTIITLSSTITSLTCQRTNLTEMNCQRSTSGLLGNSVEAIPGNVSGASVVTDYGTGVVLKTPGVLVELAHHRIGVSEKHYRIAAQINALVSDSTQKIVQVSLDDRWEGFLWGLYFGSPGIVIILASLAFPMQVCCKFDKALDQMTLEKRYCLFGMRVAHYSLSELQPAEVFKLPNSDRKPIYIVRSCIAPTQHITLSPPSRDRAQYQIIATAITRFLEYKKKG